jgi:hypothetical protein
MYRTEDPYATHQKFLEWYINKTSGDIIEFGTGHGSTGFILDIIKNTNRKLISLENNKVWLNQMKSLYKSNDNHKYIFVEDWETTINSLDKNAYSIVFIDQNPWIARQWTMDYFKDTADYVIIHDVDYFPNNNLFGKVVSEFEFDFSDFFNSYRVYYPDIPWPASSGPPTLVGTNKNLTIYNKNEINTTYLEEISLT